MTWQIALEIVAWNTKHERYRWLCSDDNPDEWQREQYRAIVVRMAINEPEPIQRAIPIGTSIKTGCCGGVPLP